MLIILGESVPRYCVYSLTTTFVHAMVTIPQTGSILCPIVSSVASEA
jgi:hypothetical protein